MSWILEDWIVALSHQAYAKQYLIKPISLGEWSTQHFQRRLVQKVYRKVHKEVLFKISEWQGTEKIWINIKDALDRQVVKVLVKSLKTYISRCQGLVELDFREIKDTSVAQLEFLFTRLKKYGNQVHFYLTEGTYLKFRQELSCFRFTLVPAS